MQSEHIVTEAVRTAGIRVPPRFLPSTGSTNADLLRAAAEGAPAWTVEVAGHQEAGRGRLGRPWVDRAGTSLLVSVLLRPPIPPAEAPLVGLAAAAAMAAALEEAAGVAAACKWPNDVLAGGRKLCGVLPEAVVEGDRLACVVVGAGLNLTQAEEEFPQELRGRATSVAAAGGRPEPGAVLESYLWRLREIVEDGPRGFPSRVLEDYRPRCETIGRTVRAETPGGPMEGFAIGIGPFGELLIEAGGRVAPVTFGEVEHLR